MESPQRFAYLFRRYLDKTCTPEEKDELFSLLLHAAHDDQLRRLIADTWNEDLPAYTQDKARADDILQRIVNRREPQSPSEAETPVIPIGSRLRFLLLNRWAAAAGIIVIPLLLIHFLHPSPPKRAIVLSSPPLAPPAQPADRCITLPDGSKVLLHKNAQLAFRNGFTPSRREVLLRGEAYFDIHRDTRPFIVHTGAIRTTVLGTAFNIDASNERQIIITVTKGKVKVENSHGGVSILGRNEQLSVDSTQLHLQRSKIDAAVALTWKKTYWLFNDVPLHEAMEELAQRYALSVVYANPVAANCPVTASFTAGESVEAMIEVLAKINNMDYSIDHGRVTITGEGCK